MSNPSKTVLQAFQEWQELMKTGNMEPESDDYTLVPIEPEPATDIPFQDGKFTVTLTYDYYPPKTEEK
jgi:hypothetical protein